MADIILVQPIVGLLDQVKDKPAIPLSLITAASMACKDYEVKIIDQRTDENWKDNLLAEMKKKPILVGTTAMIGSQIGNALEIMRVAKTHHLDIPTVWGGSAVGILPEIAANNCLVDYVVQGDGEVALKALADYFTGKGNLEDIPGIYYKNYLKEKYWTPWEVARTEPWELLDINELPEPPYDLVQVQDYLPTRFGKPTLDVVSALGCPFRCRFCYNPYLHKGQWRPLPATTVCDRISRLSDKYGVDSFWFVDDEFFVDLERAKVIISYMHNNNLAWTVQGTTVKNCLKMDDEFLTLLKASGCRQLNIGVESGSPTMLKKLNKPVKIEEVLEVNLKLKKYDIVPSFYFIVGFPDETTKEFNETLDLIEQILKDNPQATIMNVGVFTPYPNSDIMTRCLELGYELPDTLEGYVNYNVDRINTPWVLADKKTYKNVVGANFCQYFIDGKVDNLNIPAHLRIPFKLYAPVAKFRFKHRKFGFPIDINMGNRVKERINK